MRDDKDENVRWLKRFDRAQEIVCACPDTRVVTVCDRKGGGAVVESDRDRRRPCGERLPAAARAVRRRQGPFAERPAPTGRSLNLAACGGKRAQREVTLDIRARLAPPGDDPLFMLAVSVTGADGLDWLLIATEGGAEKFKAMRNGTNTAHRILQGPQVRHGRRRPAGRRRRQKCLAAITACRVLQRMARERPNAPATEVADEDGIAVPRRARHGQEQGAARKPRCPDLRGRRGAPRRLLLLQAPAVARDHRNLARRLKAYIPPNAAEQPHAQGLGGLKGQCAPSAVSGAIWPRHDVKYAD